jgi:hypothetical protein
MRLSVPILVVVVLVAVGGVAYYSGFASGFIEAFEFSFHGHPGLPSCDSSHGVDDAKRAMDNSPFAKSNNLNIIALINTKTLSVSETNVRCQATAVLNIAKQVLLDYSFTKDASFGSGQYYVQASFEADTARPYP